MKIRPGDKEEAISMLLEVEKEQRLKETKKSFDEEVDAFSIRFKVPVEDLDIVFDAFQAGYDAGFSAGVQSIKDLDK